MSPGKFLRSTLLLLCVGLLSACDKPPSTVKAIHASGELRIATLNGGTTFYEGADGAMGIEHDLGAAFARWLGVEARFIVTRDHRALRQLVKTKRAHLAAGLLPIRAAMPSELRYGPSYAVGHQLVVFRRGRPTPRRTRDLIDWHGATIEGRGARRLMARELSPNDGYHWTAYENLSVEGLLQLVDDGVVGYAVLPSFDFKTLRRYYPELEVAFELDAPQAVAWLYHDGPDDSLGQAQLEFMRDMRASGEFGEIEHRYFGHNDDFDYVASRTFLRHYDARLPQYRQDFITSAGETGLDWHLLAALGYQESQWRADARSPTGVRGLMMLTRATAAQMAVDRLDPTASIAGGAGYLKRMKKRLPAAVLEPDRTWLALAAYNLGPGHLDDARILAQQAGKNPDQWRDVREVLPTLANKKSARATKHGFARGYQALHFVRNVRRYYDVLRWLEADDRNELSGLSSADASLVTPVL
jgi:membrane-bound lytic murein transglycosylase F